MAYAVVTTNTTTNATNPLDGEFLTTEWEGITVIISIAISYSGAMYTILLNEVRGRYEPPHSNTYSLVLLIMSALSTSIRAIFFMHFVGMTAVTLHIGSTHEKVPVYFDYGWTILSAVICGLTILWAFHFASQDEFWNEIINKRTKKADLLVAKKAARIMAQQKLAERRAELAAKKSHGASHGIKSSSKLGRFSGTSKMSFNGVESINNVAAVERAALMSPAGQDAPLNPVMEEAEKSKSGMAIVQIFLESPPAQPNADPSMERIRKPIETNTSSHKLPEPPADSDAAAADKSIHRLSLDAEGRHSAGLSPQRAAMLTFGRFHYTPSQAMASSFGSFSGDTGGVDLITEILILFERPWRIFVSGFFIALAVVAMHYLGMYSMRMEAEQVFNPFIVGLSVVIAFVAATAGMFIIFRILPFFPYDSVKYVAAVIIAIAVNGMHYTGMAAVTYKYRPIPGFSSAGLVTPYYLHEVILYSEVIINIIFEAVIRYDTSSTVDFFKARAQAVELTHRKPNIGNRSS